LPKLGLKRGVIVHIYTQRDLENLLQIEGFKIVGKKVNDWSRNRQLKFKMTLLYWHTGIVTYVCKKEVNNRIE